MLSPYVRNGWYVAGWSIGDWPRPHRSPSPFSTSPSCSTAPQAGRLVALEDRCVHRLAPLSLGRCEGERLRCMYHGLLYDPDGKPWRRYPGQDLVPAAGARALLPGGQIAIPGFGFGWAIPRSPTRR